MILNILRLLRDGFIELFMMLIVPIVYVLVLCGTLITKSLGLLLPFMFQVVVWTVSIFTIIAVLIFVISLEIWLTIYNRINDMACAMNKKIRRKTK